MNTGGTHLSAQEIRNCLLIMINKSLFEKINELHDNTDFVECCPLTDNQADERYDLELVVRYLLYIDFSNTFIDSIDKSRSMDTFLTEQLEQYAQTYDELARKDHIERFTRIFHLLKETAGENVFKKYQDDKFRGPVMIAAFESIIPGLFTNIDYWESHKEDLIIKIQQIYQQPAFINASRRGTRALDRMAQLIKFSRVWFAHED